MIGTVSPLARRRRQTSRPSIRGSITSSTTRSKICSSKRARASGAVGRLHDFVAVALQREREQRLDRLLVVDEQDSGGAVCHDLSNAEDSWRTGRSNLDAGARRPRVPDRFPAGARRAVRRRVRARRTARPRARARCPPTPSTPSARSGAGDARAAVAAAAWPRRSRTAPPGSAGDARPGRPRRSRSSRRPRRRASAPAFTRPRTITPTATGDLETVIATRPGRLDAPDRRARRTATARASPSLSGTAALLELARVLKSRELRKTLVLVSTSGATTGFAGARAWAQARGRRAGRRRDRARRHGRHAAHEAVGRRRWPRRAGADAARRSSARVQAAVRRETRSDAGRPARARPVGAPRAAGHGLRAGPDRRRGPARRAALGVRRARPGRRRAGARGPPGRASGARRCAPSAALDAAGPRDGPRSPTRPNGIVTLRNVLPDWARAADRRLAAAARAARRARRVLPRPPPARADRAAGWRGWPSPPSRCRSRGCGCGCSARPARSRCPTARSLPDRCPARDERDRRDGLGAARRRAGVLRRALLVGALRRRRAPRRRRRATARAAPGARASTGSRSRPASGSARSSAIAWVRNPYAAGLLVLAAHLWLFAAGGWRGWPALVAVLVGPRVPVLRGRVHYGLALDLGPLELAWGAALGGRRGRRARHDAAARRACWPRWRASIRVLRRAPPDRARRDAGERRSARAGPSATPARARSAAPSRRCADDRPPPAAASGRALRGLSTALIVSGALLLADAGATLLWQEPVSALYARFQQGELAGPARPPGASVKPTPVEQKALESLPDPKRRLAFAARSLDRRTDDGDAGRADPDRPHRALARSSSRARTPATCARARATIPARRCRASAARSRSPGTARPTARRSARSTRSARATRSWS